MAERNAVVGICESSAEVEACIGELRGAGFDLAKLSVVGGDRHAGERVVPCHTPGERMTIPGIGPLVVSGRLAGWIAAALEGGVVIGGLSTLGAALYGIGIPESDILRYEASLESGRFLVMVHGTAAETAQARDALETVMASRIEIHPYLGDDARAPDEE